MHNKKDTMKIIKNPNNEQVDEIIEELSQDKLVVYPTDTIYGIASNIYSENAIKKVFDVKNRSLDKPLSVCVHDYSQLKSVATVTPQQEEIIKSLLPGSYTLLLKKKDSVHSILTSGSDKIGVRIPDNEISYLLTKKFPITTTSANISNNMTPDNVWDIAKQLGDSIAYYIDEGIIENNQNSTIIDLCGEYPKIVRNGKCDEEKINKILKMNL